MDKNFLLRVDDTFKQIKTQLLLNEEIRKMLYYDDITLSPVPAIEQVADHIFLQPVVSVDTTEPFNKKNYITITIPEGEPSENKIDYVLRIIVMCEKSSWNMNGDVRPLKICQEIVNILDGYKVAFSNSLKFSRIVETVTSKDVYGYSLLFEATDGISDVNAK